MAKHDQMVVLPWKAFPAADGVEAGSSTDEHKFKSLNLRWRNNCKEGKISTIVKEYKLSKEKSSDLCAERDCTMICSIVATDNDG